MVLVKQVFVLAAVFGLASAHVNGIQHRRSFGRRQGSGNDTKDTTKDTTKDGDGKGDSSLTKLLDPVTLPSDVLDTKSSTDETKTTSTDETKTTSTDETKTTSTDETKTTSADETKTTSADETKTTSADETKTTSADETKTTSADETKTTSSDDSTTTSSPTGTDTDSKTTTSTETKTTDDPLSSILSSILDPITGTPTTTTDGPTSTPTDPTSTPADPTSSTDSDSSSSSSEPTISLPITISEPTISLPITITTPTDTPTGTPTDSPTDTPTDSPTDSPTGSPTDSPTGSPTDPPVTDPPVTDPPVTDPPVTDPPVVTPPPNSTVIVDPPTITQDPPTITDEPTDPSPSPNTTVISFPQGTDGSTVIDTSTEVATTTLYSVTVASDFSDLFTATTLALAPEPTTTTVPTLTDPDAATVAPSAATTLLVAPLPSDVPSRVYPPSDPDPAKITDKTLVSLLFDTGRLPWKYVVDHDNASTQIFALMAPIVDGALGITDPNDQTQTMYLQAFVPAGYTGSADLQSVGTVSLLYVKTDAVNDLASQIKVKTSPFYTGASDPMSKELANLVVASYNILSISDPNSDGTGSSTSNASVSGSSSKTREDAIIGVVSALGGVALLVLLFLLYRAYKRRQQLANRRLSDPPNAYIGERTPGRDFDQDSVGGQRRRSFYFAEDSLRGPGQESQSSGGQAGSSGWVSFGQDGQGRAQEDEYWDYSRSQGQQMSQRRPVAGGNISAPILRGSTMNW